MDAVREDGRVFRKAQTLSGSLPHAVVSMSELERQRRLKHVMWNKNERDGKVDRRSAK